MAKGALELAGPADTSHHLKLARGDAHRIDVCNTLNREYAFRTRSRRMRIDGTGDGAKPPGRTDEVGAVARHVG